MADANFQVKKGLTVPKGSESEPSIIFTAADSDTGIYSPAEDQVAVTTAGSEVVRVNSSGQIQAVGSGSVAAPIYTFVEDNDTGIFSPGNNELAIVSSGIQRVKFGTSEVVFNDNGENVDLRIEGNSEANLVFVDASEDLFGVKTATPEVDFDVVGQVRASTGILFGTDTDEANALDDYEEGTWTATWTDSAIGALDTTVGHYTKIGNTILIEVYELSSLASASPTGDLTITGLPFACKSANVIYCGNFISRKSTGAQTVRLLNGSSTVQVRDRSTETNVTTSSVLYTNGGTNDRAGFSLVYSV